MKVCGKCGETKPNSEFSRRTKSVDGYQHYCKVCMHSTRVRSSVAARREKLWGKKECQMTEKS